MLEERHIESITNKSDFDRDTYALPPNKYGSLDTNQESKLIVKDIEEDEYIYKVPVTNRETISLRDSVDIST